MYARTVFGVIAQPNSVAAVNTDLPPGLHAPLLR